MNRRKSHIKDDRLPKENGEEVQSPVVSDVSVQYYHGLLGDDIDKVTR